VADEVWTIAQDGSETIWDGGATAWDVSGQIAQTYWDVQVDEVWSALSPGSNTWTEQ